MKDEIPASQKGTFDDWVFGCDVCQDVCPWNRFSKYHKEKLFEPKAELMEMKREDWEEISRDTFNKIFDSSAVKRTGYDGLKRNVNFLRKTS